MANFSARAVIAGYLFSVSEVSTVLSSVFSFMTSETYDTKMLKQDLHTDKDKNDTSRELRLGFVF